VHPLISHFHTPSFVILISHFTITHVISSQLCHHRHLTNKKILQLIGLPAISVWVTAIYASCGGLLVCCLETQLKFIRTIIAMNFGFLFHSIYRFLFYLLLASVAWSYGSLLGKISGGIFGAVGIFNTYILCRYPTYRKMREDIAAEEDNRIRAKINQQVRKQAISNMGWGR
jgi:hypothetical protein